MELAQDVHAHHIRTATAQKRTEGSRLLYTPGAGGSGTPDSILSKRLKIRNPIRRVFPIPFACGFSSRDVDP